MTEQEFLDEAERFAQVLDVPELAIALGKSAAEIRVAMDNPDNKLGIAIQKGRIRALAELRLNQIRLAAQGSTPAQQAVADFLKHQST